VGLPEGEWIARLFGGYLKLLQVKNMRLFSYVVEHDTGDAPNPYYRSCTLCLCKFRKSRTKPRNIVELAETGDWVVGTGGANERRSAGHGKLVYAMQVTEKLTRQQYFESPRFAAKKPVANGSDSQRRGDNKRPASSFERACQFVLISRRFYYFGGKGIQIPPRRFPHFEKKGPGFRSDFDEKYVKQFEEWITRCKAGKRGDPRMKQAFEKGGTQACKSSC
jgi:putative DNA base modification enzyme with NMAD domain